MGWLLAFVLAGARDFVGARWTKEIGTGNVVVACMYAAAPAFLDLCSLFIWLNDWHTVFATAAGYSAGTWLAIKVRRRRHGR